MFRRDVRHGLSLRAFDKFLTAPLLGIDEVGTGAIAGPIYAAGVVLPRDTHPQVLDALEKLGLKDSKRMTAWARDQVFALLTSEPSVRYWVYSRTPEEIETHGHHESIGGIFNDIITNFRFENSSGDILVDGEINSHVAYTVQWRKGADDSSLSVAAASVVAKVSRDRFMEKLQQDYPEFSFGNHKGYLTKTHQQEMDKYGFCAAHRKNTNPVRQVMDRCTSPPAVSEIASRSDSSSD